MDGPLPPKRPGGRMSARVCTKLSGPMNLMAFVPEPASLTVTFVFDPVLEVNLMEFIVMPMTPRSVTVKLMRAPLIADCGGEPLSGRVRVAFRDSLDI